MVLVFEDKSYVLNADKFQKQVTIGKVVLKEMYIIPEW